MIVDYILGCYCILYMIVYNIYLKYYDIYYLYTIVYYDYEYATVILKACWLSVYVGGLRNVIYYDSAVSVCDISKVMS